MVNTGTSYGIGEDVGSGMSMVSVDKDTTAIHKQDGRIDSNDVQFPPNYGISACALRFSGGC